METHVDESVVGSVPRGKPVGQLGIAFCDKILRPTSFETVNADDEGGYFDGLPVDCPAEDDVMIPIGDPADPNMITAQYLLENGACPAPVISATRLQKSFQGETRFREHPGGRASRRLAHAW